MEIKQIEMDNYIRRLIETTGTIKSIYDQLSKAANNEEKTKKLEEYLDLAISVEDKIYKEIGDELLFNDRFLRRTSYLIHKSNLIDKELVDNRIMNYAGQKAFLNPFPSIEYYEQDRYDENILSIKNQVCMEYIRNVIIHTDEEINKATKKRDRKRLITAKNSTLFNNKLVSSLINNERYLKSSGRSRCITLNQDEKLVDSVYGNYASNIINYCLYAILSKDESIFEQIEFRSSLDLLNKNELFQVARSYQQAVESNPQFKVLAEHNPNHELITKIIGSYMESETSKSKTKK